MFITLLKHHSKLTQYAILSICTHYTPVPSCCHCILPRKILGYSVGRCGLGGACVHINNVGYHIREMWILKEGQRA